MTDVILRISGMDCGACVVRIVRALRGLPGGSIEDGMFFIQYAVRCFLFLQ